MRCVSDLPAVVHHDFVISLLLDYRLHVIGVHHTADLIAMIEPAMGDKDKSRLVRGGILKLTRRRGLGYCPVDERRTLEIDETRRTAPGPLREHRLMGRCALLSNGKWTFEVPLLHKSTLYVALQHIEVI